MKTHCCVTILYFLCVCLTCNFLNLFNFDNTSENIKMAEAKVEALTKQFDDFKNQMERKRKDEKIVVQNPVKPPKVKKFCGERKELNRFISDMERNIKILDLDEEKACTYILSYLESRALEEVEYCAPENRDSQTKIFSILKKAFGEILPMSTLEDLFYTRKQRTGESLRDFAYHLMELIERILLIDSTFVKDKDKALRDKFSQKVRNLELRRYLKDKIRDDPSISFVDIRELALLWEAEDSNKIDLFSSQLSVMDNIESEDIKSAFISSNEVSSLQKQISDLVLMQKQQQSIMEKQQELLDTLVGSKSSRTNNDKSDKDRNIRCYACGQIGHRVKFCANRNQRLNMTSNRYQQPFYSNLQVSPPAPLFQSWPPSSMSQFTAPSTMSQLQSTAPPFHPRNQMPYTQRISSPQTSYYQHPN